MPDKQSAGNPGHYDRDKAQGLGIDMQSLRDALNNAFGEREVSTIYQSTDNFPVIMTFSDHYREDENGIGLLQVRVRPANWFRSTPSLPARAHPDQQCGQSPGPTAVSYAVVQSRGGGLAVRCCSGNGKIKAGLTMPESVFGDFAGDAAVFIKSQSNQLWLILITIAVIYVILGVLYESWVHPVTILAGIPSAAVSAHCSR